MSAGKEVNCSTSSKDLSLEKPPSSPFCHSIIPPRKDLHQGNETRHSGIPSPNLLLVPFNSFTSTCYTSTQHQLNAHWAPDSMLRSDNKGAKIAPAIENDPAAYK